MGRVLPPEPTGGASLAHTLIWDLGPAALGENRLLSFQAVLFVMPLMVAP